MNLKVFMRFSSASDIFITFNTLQGFARRPIAYTCEEISTCYINFDDFYEEFRCILANTKEARVYPEDGFIILNGILLQLLFT